MAIRKPSASSTRSTSTGSVTALAPSKSWSPPASQMESNRAVLGPRASRPHAAETAALPERVTLARAHFPRYSFDLIYARRGQSLAAWEDELDQALGLAGDHLSLYQLTIEPGTAFGTRAARGEVLVPDEEQAASLYETTQQRL